MKGRQPARYVDPTMTDASFAPEPILVSITNAAKMLSICESSFYKLMDRGEVRTVKHGRRTLVPVQALREWAASLPENQPTHSS